MTTHPSESKDSITEELKQTVKKFALKHIQPYVMEDDENQHFRMDVYQGLGELGLCGIMSDEAYGGSNLGCSVFCSVLEELAKYSVSYAVTLSVSTMTQSIIEKFGTPEQKKSYLPSLISGQNIGAFALSESHAGSDPSNMKMTAKEQGDHYLLHGNKMWITSGGIAQTYVVFAKTGSTDTKKGMTAFIVEKNTPNFEFGKLEQKMGWKASPTRELIFNQCQVKKSNLVGNPGDGHKIALSALHRGRVTIGAIALGLATSALEKAITYSIERQQFGQSVYDFQGLQFLLAEDATEIEASRSLIYRAATMFDNNTITPLISSMAKLKSTDVAMRVTTNAVQAHGGVGYTKEYDVERYMRDAKVLQIVEGTNQIQKVVIGRELRKLYEPKV
jgi:butyryl-CoA dehydrogenase